jgi:hypothetical protein
MRKVCRKGVGQRFVPGGERQPVAEHLVDSEERNQRLTAGAGKGVAGYRRTTVAGLHG